MHNVFCACSPVCRSGGNWRPKQMLQETLKECQLGKKRLRGLQGRLHILGWCDLSSPLIMLMRCVASSFDDRLSCNRKRWNRRGSLVWAGGLEATECSDNVSHQICWILMHPPPHNLKNYSNGNQSNSTGWMRESVCVTATGRKAVLGMNTALRHTNWIDFNRNKNITFLRAHG